MLNYPPKKMDKAINYRIKAFYDAMKKMKLFSSYDDLRRKLLNRDGEMVSQPFLSNVMNAHTPAPDLLLSQLEEKTPANMEYIVNGEGLAISLHKMLRYVLDSNDISLKKWCMDTGLSHSQTSRLTDDSSIEKWNEVIDNLNESFDLSISIKTIKDKSTNAQIQAPEFKGKSDHVERLFEVIDSMIKRGRISSQKDFCEVIGISPSHLSNMRNPDSGQDVTKDMIVSTLSKFTDISPDWFLLGVGEMYRSSADVFPVMMELLKEVRDTRTDLDLLRKFLDYPMSKKSA